MTRGALRAILPGTLLAVAAGMTTAVGVYFLVAKVPRLVQRERTEISLLCRRRAEGLAGHTETADFTVPNRPKGWRQTGRLQSGRPWGHVAASRVPGSARSTGRLAWIETPNGAVRGVWVDGTDESDVGEWLAFGIPIVLLVLLATTGLAVHALSRYARERDDFLAATAHDLTTPLVGMRYMIGHDDAEAARLNERMIRLVENIKDFLRLGGHRAAPKCEKFDLAAAFRSAYGLFAADFRDLFEGRDVPLDGGDVPCNVLGDETLCVQILWNLLGNDLKYAAPYGSVAARIARDGSRARLVLADTGRGMTRRQMRKAFDRYYRASTAMESGKGGFGIGLATSREFARAMGGELSVSANRPTGCVFTLELPLAP